jgi:uncharacterized protein YidB (DUF937 family)
MFVDGKPRRVSWRPTRNREEAVSLLTTVIGAMLGGSGGGSPMERVLMSLLAGDQAPRQVQDPRQQGGGPTGLGGLLSAFQQAGLGNIAQSWISNGPNQPVSPGQLRDVLGQDRVDAMAQQSGMASHDFLSQLSEHLPKVVDQLTPHGRLPDEGTVSV